MGDLLYPILFLFLVGVVPAWALLTFASWRRKRIAKWHAKANKRELRRG